MPEEFETVRLSRTEHAQMNRVCDRLLDAFDGEMMSNKMVMVCMAMAFTETLADCPVEARHYAVDWFARTMHHFIDHRAAKEKGMN